ncbi:hypothetical protein DBR43_28820 [Pedobacter sp. KBW06]|nr:hypothetical protein DBR43_28820 [Pedobacter sp. KBW06]
MAGYYAYMGSGDYLVPTNYRSMTPGIPLACSNGGVVCAVYLNDTTEIPLTPFSSTLIQNITDAVGSASNQGTPGLPDHVTMRP